MGSIRVHDLRTGRAITAGRFRCLKVESTQQPDKAAAMQPTTGPVSRCLARRSPVTSRPLSRHWNQPWHRRNRLGNRLGDGCDSGACLVLRDDRPTGGTAGDDRTTGTVLSETPTGRRTCSAASSTTDTRSPRLLPAAMKTRLNGWSARSLRDGGKRLFSDHDPRWDRLRDNPKFVELMTTVALRLDEERTKVADIEARVDFIADFEREHGPAR